MENRVQYLQELTEKIHQLKTAILLDRKRMFELSLKIQHIEIETKGVIADALDDCGKPKFGNETKRTAAMMEVLNADVEYQSMLNTKKEEETRIDLAGIELDDLLRKYRNEELQIKWEISIRKDSSAE